MNYLPINDGIDHINIYSKSNNELGRLLSNFANTPFTHPVYGSFQSVEGFWYYYFTECKHEKLKELHGHKAKEYGRLLKNGNVLNRRSITCDDKEIILEAIRLKLKQNRYILSMLIENKLPLTHYYYYGNIDNPKIYYMSEYSWITDEYERIRNLMNNYIK